MTERPTLTLSSLDLHRIEQLLDALSHDALQAHASLLEELERANVVEPGEVPPTVVTMNSTVRFRTEPDGKEFERTLVYPAGFDGSPEKVSVLAPIGSAMLGLSVGDSIEWPAPRGGTMTVRIMEILYQPESSGEFHR
ncbi:nucleoside diphosphate kinase regulator [Thioalkalivibrio paradoxus]|uniref:Nucleoside diphosphate kinase regulator n=1 Tax=Thioalkalivibrio paradoxus ARh 1 TaxID=713585 RepID=W0DKE5_9GAMM|nr:nucleoside diphosphate kinase regulator [Thioalkalivibrio paradoxus]AHE98926.1 nucleoside diphosphate kinase regulator [Thioalkalivibrio paradoxus ARh 1]